MTEMSLAVLSNFGIGRTRHSVRAVAVNPHAWIGNGGRQRTACPTRRCPKVNFNCYIYLEGSIPSTRSTSYALKIIGFIEF